MPMPMPKRVLFVLTFIAWTKGEVVELSDETFEKETQCTSGATTGDWLVRMYHEKDAHANFVLATLAEALDTFDDKWINVATVDCAANPEIGARFNVTDAATRLFVRGRMYDFTRNETLVTADFLRNFTKRPRNETLEDGGRGNGERIPRGPTWLTPFIAPVTDRLDAFFLECDYRLLSTALCGFAVVLVLVGAFTPHADGDDDDESAEKKTPAKAPGGGDAPDDNDAAAK